MAAELHTNIKGLYVLFVKTSVGVVGVCILTTVLFQRFIALGTRLEQYVLLALWVLLPVTWIVWALMTRAKWSKTSYVLTRDAIAVQVKRLGGGVHSDLYRYDAIISVSVRAGVWGGLYGYGDVHIAIPQIHKTIVLRFINQPDTLATKIKAHVAAYNHTQHKSPSM